LTPSDVIVPQGDQPGAGVTASTLAFKLSALSEFEDDSEIADQLSPWNGRTSIVGLGYFCTTQEGGGTLSTMGFSLCGFDFAYAKPRTG